MAKRKPKAPNTGNTSIQRMADTLHGDKFPLLNPDTGIVEIRELDAVTDTSNVGLSGAVTDTAKRGFHLLDEAAPKAPRLPPTDTRQDVNDQEAAVGISRNIPAIGKKKK